MVTNNNQSVLHAITHCMCDYEGALAISSRIGMDLYLGEHYMFNGLCDYFRRKYPELATQIMAELRRYSPTTDSIDGYFFTIPKDCTSQIQLLNSALRPRYELLQRTIARLQPKLQTTTP